MESDQGKEYQSGDEQPDEQVMERGMNEAQESVEVVPGVPVVRGNTPRPLSFNSLLAASGRALEEQPEIPTARPTFPSEAPSAPPLPEELEDSEGEASGDVEVATLPEDAPQEFIWLFEYGLEMDSALLNSAERLDGTAFLYGPAVLKGYILMFAETVRASARELLATIVPSTDPDAEAWGVLYRIPRHITMHNGSQPSLLDVAHSSGSPDSLFRPISVVVREVYRGREITCGTYTLSESARRQLPLLSLAQVDHSLSLVQHLASLARKQKFPERYLKLSTTATPAPTQRTVPYRTTAATPLEQNTEPIPVLKERAVASVASETTRKFSANASPGLLSALAIYLILVLLLVLTFAVLQGVGFGSRFLTPGLLILGVPWLVLAYGLLGACMSSLVSLGRSLQVKRPLFVIILWFARPYLGIVLAALAYLLFNSGLFVIAEPAKPSTLLPLLGALAGLSESWFFLRRTRLSG